MALNARDRIVLDTLLPAGAHPLLSDGVLELGFGPFYEEFERTQHRSLRTAFRLALLAASWIAPLLIGLRPPLNRHARDDRERALEAMAASRSATLRRLLVLLKLVAALSYGGRASVRERVGYARGEHP